jgi:hypothetical protein
LLFLSRSATACCSRVAAEYDVTPHRNQRMQAQEGPSRQFALVHAVLYLQSSTFCRYPTLQVTLMLSSVCDSPPHRHPRALLQASQLLLLSPFRRCPGLSNYCFMLHPAPDATPCVPRSCLLAAASQPASPFLEMLLAGAVAVCVLRALRCLAHIGQCSSRMVARETHTRSRALFPCLSVESSACFQVGLPA